MRTIDRHLRRTLYAHFAIAIATLLAIFSVVNLAEELETVGRGEYGVGQALRFVVLNLPYEAYELFAPAALLGGVTGLGNLAAHAEIVALRACGVSPGRILFFVLRSAAGLAVAAVVLAEGVVPPLSQAAYAERSIAMSDGTAMVGHAGLWVRGEDRFVNVRRPSYDGTLRDVVVYRFDDERRLTRVVAAESAEFADGRWRLAGVTTRDLSPAGAEVRRSPEAYLAGLPSPEEIRRLLFPAEALGSIDVWNAITSLEARGESSGTLALTLWKRILTPITTLVMVLLATPIVLDVPVRGGMGSRIVVGAMIGVAYPLITQTLTQAGLVYGIAPAITTSIPALVAVAAALWLLRKRAA